MSALPTGLSWGEASRVAYVEEASRRASSAALSSSTSLVIAAMALPDFSMMRRKSAFEIPSLFVKVRICLGSPRSIRFRSGGCFSESISNSSAMKSWFRDHCSTSRRDLRSERSTGGIQLSFRPRCNSRAWAKPYPISRVSLGWHNLQTGIAQGGDNALCNVLGLLRFNFCTGDVVSAQHDRRGNYRVNLMLIGHDGTFRCSRDAAYWQGRGCAHPFRNG